MSLFTEEAEKRAKELQARLALVNRCRQAPRVVRADYAGFQSGTLGIAGFHLFTLREPIPGHPAGSTVSEQTILEAGYRLASRPATAPIRGER